MKVAVPKETAPGERRVALVPEVVAKLVKDGFEVLFERGAGEGAFFSDAEYESAGARPFPDAGSLFAEADVVLKVAKPSAEEAERLREGSALISFLQPHLSLPVVAKLAARRVTAFSMELVPRITRAQSMDALSSMSTLAGYKAVLLGAAALGRIVPMVTSAAGTLTAARVFVIGAGVAGLQAIATARRLGGVVSAFDIRPATKEQVKSLGAQFVEMELAEATEEATGYARELSQDSQARALETIRTHARSMDLVVSSALVPGKPAPRLLPRATVEGMKRGSVIVDMAAEMGGNCECTRPGEEVREGGVTILGPVNLPSTLPIHASQMYARNVAAVLRHLAKDGTLRVDFEDPIAREMCLTLDGRVVHEPTMKLLEGKPG